MAGPLHRQEPKVAPGRGIQGETATQPRWQGPFQVRNAQAGNEMQLVKDIKGNGKAFF